MIFDELYKTYQTCTFVAAGVSLYVKDIITFEDLKDMFLSVYEKTYKDKYPNPADILRLVPPRDIITHIVQLCTNNPETKNNIKTSLQKYFKSHPFLANRSCACMAPRRALRFDFNGRITVCCANLTYTLGTYPETTPQEAWNSNKLKRLREAISQHDFSLGCYSCAHQIAAGNGMNSILQSYNDTPPSKFQSATPDTDSYPSRLIFQIHNTCNYQCIMCSGEYSSSICRNRDNRPAPVNVYDDAFIDQITPFLKHATSAEFLGGEPFLIPLYFKMWNVIKQVNPDMDVHIITNGSIFNDKIKASLEDLANAHIHISLDSLNPDTYAYIRRNGNLKTVLNNIEHFLQIKKAKSISMCPIIQNVYEIPDLVKYAHTNGLGFRINNVIGTISPAAEYKGLYKSGYVEPPRDFEFKESEIGEFRLWTLSIPEKKIIKSILIKHTYPTNVKNTIDSFLNFLTDYTP